MYLDKINNAVVTPHIMAQARGSGLLRSYISSYVRVVAVQCCRDRQCYSTVNGDADGIIATRDDGADQLKEPDMKEITRSTSSLRVDAIAAAGLGLSRRCPQPPVECRDWSDCVSLHLL